MTDKLKIGQEVLIHGYVDEIRKDTIIIQNDGGYFGTVECEVTDIEMPSTNKILNKIWLEIKALEKPYGIHTEDEYTGAWNDAIDLILDIIDKYNRKEQE